MAAEGPSPFFLIKKDQKIKNKNKLSRIFVPPGARASVRFLKVCWVPLLWMLRFPAKRSCLSALKVNVFAAIIIELRTQERWAGKNGGPGVLPVRLKLRCCLGLLVTFGPKPKVTRPLRGYERIRKSRFQKHPLVLRTIPYVSHVNPHPPFHTTYRTLPKNRDKFSRWRGVWVHKQIDYFSSSSTPSTKSTSFSKFDLTKEHQLQSSFPHPVNLCSNIF